LGKITRTPDIPHARQFIGLQRIVDDEGGKNDGLCSFQAHPILYQEIDTCRTVAKAEIRNNYSAFAAP
jgi:hypothetical protein